MLAEGLQTGVEAGVEEASTIVTQQQLDNTVKAKACHCSACTHPLRCVL